MSVLIVSIGDVTHSETFKYLFPLLCKGRGICGALGNDASWEAVVDVCRGTQDIRKVVQVLEQTAREILTLLQSVHQPSGFKEGPSKCAKAKELFCTVRTQLGELKNKFPVEQYYRFHEHWRFVLQRLAYLAAFEVYLESASLMTRDEVVQILGIELVGKKGFHLDVEDYLAGVLMMASELSCLAVNSITAGDNGRPLRISKELDSGFRLLNLKNDPLRKRYDGLKYDVEKIEVVYDLSIRGLTKE
ncbi:translin-like [Oncorhynchus keta]|uniref:translin-like n=1 Tax=Oncorhynchus keta TaxID=8018 RepID=UPI00227BB3DA|nr:translin-like [Oncorhynchus keta]